MARELHILGPPGTGKTFRCAEGARRAAEAYGPDRVLLLSLTKAAAREAAGRDTPLPKRNIGTLHSICYHALGQPDLLAPDHIREWNALHPQWQLPTDIVTGAEEGYDPAEPAGASIYAEYQLARARQLDRRAWRDGLRAFALEFEVFKEAGDLHDFTDLIERAYHEKPIAPGAPVLIIADEVQDFSRLEISLLRRWAQHARDLVMAGDPLQAIHDWRGADPEVFHNPDAAREILCESTPSYRCPRAVWQRATAFAYRLLEEEGVRYLPRDGDGLVGHAPDVRSWSPDDGPPGMLIATCRQFLYPLISQLRNQGVPYHNPYARGWNPLRMSGTLGTLLALAAPGEHWMWGDLRRFIPHLTADCFHGTKARAVESIPPDDEAWSWAALSSWLTERLRPGVVDGLFDCLEEGDPGWYVEQTVGSFQRWASYPLQVVRRTGARELRRQISLPARERPWFQIGTVHSFKGGEADRVFLWPDLSRPYYEQSRRPGWHGRDALTRLFYVAMTRAREELRIGAGGRLQFPL